MAAALSRTICEAVLKCVSARNFSNETSGTPHPGRPLPSRNSLRQVFSAALLMGLAACGAEPGAFVEQPNLVGKITDALVASKVDELKPQIYRDGDRQFSYYLKSVAYLGILERGSEKFVLATAFFVRSSARGSEFRPARGHGYLLCLSPQFHLVAHCPLDRPDVELVGTVLRRQEDVIADFAAEDEATRTRGFLIDGSNFLPYPFADKLARSTAPQGKKP